jgi:hypothetical protein
VRSFALLAALVELSAMHNAAAEPLAVTVHRIDNFALSSSGAVVGSLEFLGGLDVSSDDRDFGGLSGIDMLDAETAFMISDSGTFVRARLLHEDGRLVGLADAEIESLFPDGDRSKELGDCEDVAIDPSDRRRGVIVRERQANAMLIFDLAGDMPTNFTPKLVGVEDRILRSNKGLESVAYAPRASSFAGEIITIAERPPRGEEDIPGWIAGAGNFAIVRRDEFDVSSARFLPNGDLMLLERRYTPGWGIAMRLRRIAGDAFKVGARLDGEILLDAGMTSQIDNMEGLAVSQDDAGRTILTIVSDDNYSVLQRTLILQFALTDD